MRLPYYLLADDVPVPDGWTVSPVEGLYDQLAIGVRRDGKSSFTTGTVPVVDQSVTFSVGGWFGHSPLKLLSPAAVTTDCDGIAVARVRGAQWIFWGGKVIATAAGTSDVEYVTVPSMSVWSLVVLMVTVLGAIIRQGVRHAP